MKDWKLETRVLARIGIVALLLIALYLGLAVAQEGTHASQSLESARSAQTRATSVTKQLTPRVRYKRVQAGRGLRAVLARISRDRVETGGPSAPRALSVTKGPHGFVSARLDPLSVMEFAVIQRTAAGEPVVACVKQPGLASASDRVASTGGRQ